MENIIPENTTNTTKIPQTIPQKIPQENTAQEYNTKYRGKQRIERKYNKIPEVPQTNTKQIRKKYNKKCHEQKYHKNRTIKTQRKRSIDLLDIKGMLEMRQRELSLRNCTAVQAWGQGKLGVPQVGMPQSAAGWAAPGCCRLACTRVYFCVFSVYFMLVLF